ncbi:MULTISPECIES: DivIVA domain-containing protein [Planococcus]|uniref:Septum formation initiator n=2 Tax=Planococcus TaxID=1372 RepID=A0ABM5WV40_9BACL|nr:MULTISPECIES: DivIVA domain-containing protein [Planococcus]ALS78213.1 septum formation initiator [Planococcus kocurii]AQU79885.1 septum formation initiator [Planococcus faecalis]KAA0958396.1 DivIVA domain-containing protein [Planococcus sp. ANT_H30]MDJ0330751.1 DivIVA domain-containing protein [Planococcus sp. S3-L1]OHX53462.1 septum formation initiator [Planococcus faecalis]
MPLSPLDIHNKEFSRAFRGYQEDEVNEFLEQIMRDYEILLKDKATLEERLRTTDERVGHFNTIESTLQKSIFVAQEASEEVRRNSQKEAELIVKEAEKNADRIVNESLTKARRIATEIEELKKQSRIFKNRFKMLVEAQLDLIETDDWETLLEYDIDTQNLEKIEKDKEESNS